MLPGGNAFVRALLTHPNTPDVAADSLSASIDYDIRFSNADLVFRRRFRGDSKSCWNVRTGLRYSTLDQDMRTLYTINGETAVTSEIEFRGYGPQLGLDASRTWGRNFDMYGSGVVSFVFGEFESNYAQIGQLTMPVTGFDDDRVVPVLEYEIGFGWTSDSGCVRLKSGYYVGSWYNVVTTSEFIRGIRAGSFDNIDDSVTFHGFTAGLDFSF